MPRQTSSLALRQSVLQRTLLDGNVTRYPQSYFLDFVIDGQSLIQRLKPSADLVTPLNRAWLPTVPDALDELRGRRPASGLAEHRIALLVCGGCGDLECGAITASLSVTTDQVSWTEFRWEDGFQPRYEPIAAAGPGFTFDRASYDTTFSEAYDRIAALPYNELAHRGRKFLWPWQWGWRLPKPGG